MLVYPIATHAFLLYALSFLVRVYLLAYVCLHSYVYLSDMCMCIRRHPTAACVQPGLHGRLAVERLSHTDERRWHHVGAAVPVQGTLLVVHVHVFSSLSLLCISLLLLACLYLLTLLCDCRVWTVRVRSIAAPPLPPFATTPAWTQTRTRLQPLLYALQTDRQTFMVSCVYWRQCFGMHSQLICCSVSSYCFTFFFLYARVCYNSYDGTDDQPITIGAEGPVAIGMNAAWLQFYLGGVSDPLSAVR